MSDTTAPVAERLSPERLAEITARNMGGTDGALRLATVARKNGKSLMGQQAADIADLLKERATLVGIINGMLVGVQGAEELIATGWPDDGSCDGGSGECKCTACRAIAKLWAVTDLAGVKRPVKEHPKYRPMTLSDWEAELATRRASSGAAPGRTEE